MKHLYDTARPAKHSDMQVYADIVVAATHSCLRKLANACFVYVCISVWITRALTSTSSVASTVNSGCDLYQQSGTDNYKQLYKASASLRSH